MMRFFVSPKKILLLLMICLAPFVLSAPKSLDAQLKRGAQGNVKVVVLNYHKVDDTVISLSVSPAQFEEQMAYLKAEGYNSITPDQLAANLKDGRELPEKPLLITFDDGYADNYANAYPILKKYGFSATIFVVTDFLDRYPNYITWAQAKEMSQNGMTIASHTMQHKSLTELTDEEIRQELKGSAAALNYHLGEKKQYIAYPTGTHNLHLAALVRECGYEAGFTVKYGNVDRASNVYALERVPVFRTEHTFQSFLDRLRYLPVFERLGWVKS